MKSNILLILLLSTFVATFTGARTPKLDEPLAGEAALAATRVPKLAAALAATLANREAKKKFDSEPFSPSSADAILRGGHWEWQANVGYGKGDLRATVSFQQDGTQQKVEVIRTVDEPRSRPELSN